MPVFGTKWVEAIQESAEAVAQKYGVPERVFNCLRPYIIDLENQYIAWEFDRFPEITYDQKGISSYQVYEPDEHLRNMPSGDYLYLWAEVRALAFVLLNETLDETSQQTLYRELEKKLALAEVNIMRAKKLRSEKYNKGLQSVINGIVGEIRNLNDGECSLRMLSEWLAENAVELETSEPDCDELTFVYGLGDNADTLAGEYIKDSITWVNAKGETKQIAISSLQPYFTRSKKALST